MNEEKKIIYPDTEIVQELVRSIDELLCSKHVRVLESLSALMTLIIARSQYAGINKPTILGYISNMWELNDEETDHPDKEKHPKVTY